MQFADISAPSFFVEKDARIAFPDSFAADQKNVAEIVYGMQMIGCHLNTTIEIVSEFLTVRAGVDFIKMRRVIDHTVFHISGGDKNSNKIFSGFVRRRKRNFKIYDSFDKVFLTLRSEPTLPPSIPFDT